MLRINKTKFIINLCHEFQNKSIPEIPEYVYRDVDASLDTISWKSLRYMYLNGKTTRNLSDLIQGSAITIPKESETNRRSDKLEHILARIKKQQLEKEYFQMVADVMTEKDKLRHEVVDIEDLKSIKSLTTTIINVLLSGVSVFAFIFFCANWLSIETKTIASLIGAIFIVACECALIVIVCKKEDTALEQQKYRQQTSTNPSDEKKYKID